MAQDELQTLLDLLNGFDTAVLITHAGNNRLHGRPMVVAEVEETGDIWFVTGLDTPKMDEIRSNDHVLVTMQDGDSKFVSIAGRAELVRDAYKVGELWKDRFKTWFPGGKDDPNLVLIHVRGQEAEYWDNAGANKVVYAFQAMAARVRGQRPEVREGQQHGKIGI